MSPSRPSSRFVIASLGLVAFVAGGAATATWAGAFDAPEETLPDLAIELSLDGPVTWPEDRVGRSGDAVFVSAARVP